MEKSQLKIKLKIVKVVTDLEMIQPQFLTGQHFLVFDKRKLKKKSETPSLLPPPPPPKRENDVSRYKSIFDSYHVVIFRHWLYVRLFHLYISVLA